MKKMGNGKGVAPGFYNPGLRPENSTINLVRLLQLPQKDVNDKIMSYSTYQWGPDKTPKVVFHLILWTSLVTVFSAIFQVIFNQFALRGPLDYFSLSWWGLHNWFIWQPLTYLFVQAIPPYGVSFFYLITLFFNMYLIWVMGSALVEIIGTQAFLRLYLLSGSIAGILTILFSQSLSYYTFLAGPAPAILALMTVWTMIYPEMEILLFFLVPIKGKWLMAGLIGIILFLTLMQGDLIYFILYMSGILFGYFYALGAWKLASPFAWLNPFDRFIYAFSDKIRGFLPRWHRDSNELDKISKVIDFKTGKTLVDDDAFVDAMLTKIAQQGEKSLSRSERRRLNEISERKNKK